LGITPDIDVPQAKVELLEASRARSEASLRNAIKNGNGEKTTEGESKPGTEAQPTTGAADAPAEEKPQDYQLTRALDLLQGISLYNKSAAE